MKRLADYSQYFLRSPQRIKELIGHTTIKKTDTVLDIGAGSGVISSILASRAAHVLAYENDHRMIMKLQENLGRFDTITIIEQDFLTATLPTGDYKVFSNIPFHLSSPILRKLTEADNPPVGLWLIVQRQFGAKLIIGTDHFTGQLGAMVAPLYEARIRQKLERTDYFPHPAVDTVMIELILRNEPLVAPARMSAYRRFIADCFSDPKIFTSMPLSAASVSAGTKPSQLTLDQWLAIFARQHRY